MAKRIQLRPRRTFSEDVKRKVVSDIEMGRKGISTVVREYGVCSASVYNWINKFSTFLKSSPPVRITMEDEFQKQQQLEKRLTELERLLGQKQVQVEFLEQLIALAGKELKMDLKKSFATRL
ncbi:MAG: transposase [Sphingobacteriales bacterium]|nr:MAG: transposase [Sphingobacteriales bacterium]